MVRTSDMRVREVVNIVDGRRLGVIDDVEIDLDNGRITAIVIPGGGRFLGFFGKNDEYIVPWEKIRRIGVDTILVELEGTTVRPGRRADERE